MAFLLRCLLVAMLGTYVLAHAEQRVALVIGNSNYPSALLENPRNDATAIAASFKRLGFDVDLILDVTKAELDATLKRFSDKADNADVAILFYAGHGIQVNNFNYLVPINAKPQSERDLKRELVKLDDAIDDMGNAKIKLVFFDACRDNPLSRSFGRGTSRGLAAPNESTGILISFATKHGNTAADGDGKHSPYTEVLLAALESPLEEIHALLRKKVQQGVKQKTGGKQEPWTYGNLNGDFYFIYTPVNIIANTSSQPIAAPRLKSAVEREEELWDSIKDANSVETLNEYLRAYPKGKFVPQARILITKLKKDSSRPSVSEKSIVASAPVESKSDDTETALWSAVERGSNEDDYTTYLMQFPKGKFAALANSRRAKLRDQAFQAELQREAERWAAADVANSEEGYAAYLVAYPSGRFAQLAMSRQKKLREEKASIEEQESWKSAEASNDKALILNHLNRFPGGRYDVEARQRIAQIEKDGASNLPGKIFQDCPDCPEMVIIPAGSFQMGGFADNEQPIHSVTIRAFAIGKTEVTQKQWKALMGENPS